MIISRKKYEKLNDDLIDAKTKVDDAKKSLDEENKIMRATLLIKKQRDQYKAERDTLIDDLPWYKAKVSRLERENEELKESHIKHITNMENYYKDRVQELKEENKDKNRIISKRLEHENNHWYQMHKECADAVYNKKMMYESLLSEISQHIGNKPSSSTYKYFRTKLDGIGIKEDE